MAQRNQREVTEEQYYERLQKEGELSKSRETPDGEDETDVGGEVVDKEEADYEEMLEKAQTLDPSSASAPTSATNKVRRSKSAKQIASPPPVFDLNSGQPYDPEAASFEKQTKDGKKEKTKKTVHLMTTVAAPVFDTKNSTVSDRFQSRQTYIVLSTYILWFSFLNCHQVEFSHETHTSRLSHSNRKSDGTLRAG